MNPEIVLPDGFKVEQRTFLVAPDGSELHLRTDMRIGTGISLASGFCPPASGGGGDIEVWTGGTRPADFADIGGDEWTTAPVGAGLVGWAGTIDATGVSAAIQLGFFNAAFTEGVNLQNISIAGNCSIRGFTETSGQAFDEPTDANFAATTTYSIGFLRTIEGVRLYVCFGAEIYSGLIPNSSIDFDLWVAPFEGYFAGESAITGQQWFTGTISADTYPASNLVSDWVAANSGA